MGFGEKKLLSMIRCCLVQHIKNIMSNYLRIVLCFGCDEQPLVNSVNASTFLQSMQSIRFYANIEVFARYLLKKNCVNCSNMKHVKFNASYSWQAFSVD